MSGTRAIKLGVILHVLQKNNLVSPTINGMSVYQKVFLNLSNQPHLIFNALAPLKQLKSFS